MTRKYMAATDVGGTCTDTIVFAAGEPAHLGKTLSTPPDFSVGVIHSIRSAADAMGISLADLLTQMSLFMHGSTVVDNTILTREGARTGLITTRGLEDTVLMTRGAYGRWGGLTEDRVKHPVKTERAPPLVAPDCIVGVPERADYKLMSKRLAANVRPWATTRRCTNGKANQYRWRPVRTHRSQ